MTDAKREANKRWSEKNKDKVRYYNYRTKTRHFLKNLATVEDLDEVQELVNNKRKELNQ